MNQTDWIWRDGEYIPWAQATTHVLAHALHYGSSVFEGIRAYTTPQGPRIFRLKEHLVRLFDSARIYQMPMRFDLQQLGDACGGLMKRNKMSRGYLRPLVFRGHGVMGLDPTDCPVETVVAAWDWGKYLKTDEGIDVGISSWRRVAADTLPSMAKAGGNYLSSQLIRLEAKRHGYHEGIALTADGIVSEGSGENLFAVRHDVLYTPDAASSILLGITRDTVMLLAAELGYEVQEIRMPREMLYTADEVFLCGTAAEITPVRSVDRTVIGNGKPGPVTLALQKHFFGLFDGTVQDEHGWLTSLDQPLG